MLLKKLFNLIIFLEVIKFTIKMKKMISI